MLKRTIVALALSTSLATGAALAQSAASFVTDQGTGEYRASKFVGLDVYGSENEKIGDIKEILIDGTGAAKSAVLGVGGFLGIGEKSVAVPFSALKWVNAKPASTASATTGSTGTAAPAGGMAPSGGMTPGGGMASGGATPPAAPARSPDEQAAYNGYPDHATITLSKADLQNAPAFKYYADTHASSGAPSNATPPAVPKP